MARISQSIEEAKALLESEEIVAIPTETVYGLAGNIFSEKAIKRIFELKGRPLINPLIVHINDLDMLELIAQDIPEDARILAEHFWPGPLTMVLPKKANVPDIITANKPTVAVRMPAHPVTKALLAQLDFPLAAPSANPFKRISPTKAQHVADYFTEGLELVLEGGTCEKGIESTIIGFENGKAILYRHGALAKEEIEALIGEIGEHTSNDESPEAPGMLLQHYSPKTPLILVDDVSEAMKDYPSMEIGIIVFSTAVANHPENQQMVLSEQGSLIEAASKLYTAMHDLDQLGLDLIIAEIMPLHGVGVGMNDRLRRASR
jgi:L-threonylcarbamoyladenylate synthase